MSRVRREGSKLFEEGNTHFSHNANSKSLKKDSIITCIGQVTTITTMYGCLQSSMFTCSLVTEQHF